MQSNSLPMGLPHAPAFSHAVIRSLNVRNMILLYDYKQVAMVKLKDGVLIPKLRNSSKPGPKARPTTGEGLHATLAALIRWKP